MSVSNLSGCQILNFQVVRFFSGCQVLNFQVVRFLTCLLLGVYLSACQFFLSGCQGLNFQVVRSINIKVVRVIRWVGHKVF